MRKDFVCPHARNCHLALGKEAETRCCRRGARQRRIASAARRGARWHGPAFPGSADVVGQQQPRLSLRSSRGLAKEAEGGPTRDAQREVAPSPPPASSGEDTTRGEPRSGGLLFHPWELDRVHRSCAPNSVTSTRKTKWQ